MKQRGDMDVSGENFSPVQPVAIVGAALRFPGALDPLSFHDLTLSGRRLFQLGYGPGHGGITPCHALAAEAAAAAIADTRLGRSWSRRALAKHGKSGVIVAHCPSQAMVSDQKVPPVGAWVGQRLGLAAPVPPERWLLPPELAASAMGCSLRAVATACEALNRGEFDLMLAGGVAVGSGGDARKRDIRVYDANPTGIAPGEGCGMVVLMRAADARRAGLPVYAEIAGWSTPEDGPDLRAVIRAAYLRAGIDPADVQLVEGHGAATADDDQAELAALLDVLDHADGANGGSTCREGAAGGCALGSVAANIGDTRGAAGVAALLKASLAMTAATIPPTTGCVEPHELLRERDTTFRLPPMAEDWPGNGTQLAAVNSLGAATSGTSRSGGTHLVLRREPDARRPGRRRRVTGARGIPPQGSAPHDLATALRSCPIRHAAPEPGRPRHVVLPRPRPPQDLQRASLPVEEGQPVLGRQSAAQWPLASAGRQRDAASVAARAEVDDAPALVTKASRPDASTAAVVTGPGSGGPGGLVRQGPPGQAAALPGQPPAPYLRVQRLLAVQSAAIIDRLTAAMASTQVPGQDPALPPDPVAAPPGPRPRPEAESPPPAGSTDLQRAARRLGVQERGTGSTMIVTVRGRDRTDLIARLEGIAAGTAADPSGSPATVAHASSGKVTGDGARAALVGAGPAELMALARRAAEILRISSPGLLRSWPQRDAARQEAPGGCPATPGIYLSEGARGQVTLVFGGLAWTSADHVSALSASASTLAWARRLGIDPHVAAAFGLGEIIGLAWAEAITHDEAARLAALRAEILRSVGGLTSMARVYADRETTARLLAGTQLVRAIDEGPVQQVVAGPLPSVRALPHQAADLGVRVELLSATCGLHSGDMWPCVPPMAAIAAGTPVGPLRRRLISSVTGIDFALSGAPADLLARQLERPALLASAISLATTDADLVLLATPEVALAEAAMSCCCVPVLLPPPDASSDPAPEVLAALFTASVIDDAWSAPGLPPGAGRLPVPDQAPAMYRVPRPSRDWGASVTVG
jgi:acyl transferase domain-containing protein